MKKLLAIFMTLGCCLSFSLGQGIQGNVRFAGRATVVLTGHSVTLTWDPSQGAASYNIYRAPAHGGPYLKQASGIAGTTYTDTQITHNQTLYYVTTAVNGNYESGYSNESVAVIP